MAVDFVVKKSELLRELQYAQGGVERKATVPILSNLLLETTGNTLAVTATDLDVTMRCTCPASIKTSGALAVSARKLFDIVRLLPEADVHFKSAGQTWINITCERAKFKIASLSKDTFPDIPSLDMETMTLPAEPLHYMATRCAFAITQEESRYTLSGALMMVDPATVTFVATDGHRLVFISHSVKTEGVDSESRVLVPRKTLNELSKLTADTDAKIEFGHSENHLFFRVGERLLVSRVLTGQFPNYKMVIPQENDKCAVLNVAEFAAALKRVSVMADEESHSVRLSVKKDQLDIQSSGTEIGEAKETMPANYQEEDLEIGFNARYVLDFLGGLESTEIELHLRDGETQGLFKPKPQGDYQHQYVLMPMKL
ncbi:MAG: DNA polymerase III subunit beta [Acidobacteriota bacterium]